MEEKITNTYSYKSHLKNGQDLVTTYEETRAGFIALALEKNRLASPYIDQARALKTSATQATSPMALLEITEIQTALLSASGISDKASKFLQEEDKKKAIIGLIENFLQPAGDSFVEELVYRFLLTKGDALGGSMRNVGGSLAQRRLSRLVISYLSLQAIPFSYKDAKTNTWVQGQENEADIELTIKGLSWNTNGAPRTILYNLGVPFVGNNIDMCLFNSTYENVANVISEQSAYLALGELKGGIDPAGADEHWKTAKTALGRIRQAFPNPEQHPTTFFIGAAIATRMADEIWKDLEDGVLDNAANLTDLNQVNSLAQWLCNL